MKRLSTLLVIAVFIAFSGFAYAGPLDRGYEDLPNTEEPHGDDLNLPQLDWVNVDGQQVDFGTFANVTVEFEGKQTQVTEEQIRALLDALEEAVAKGSVITGTVTVDGIQVPIADELKRQAAWWAKAKEFAPMVGVDGASSVGANAFVEDKAITVDSPQFEAMFAAALEEQHQSMESPRDGGQHYTVVRTIAATYAAINDGLFKYNQAAFLSSSSESSVAYGAPAYLNASVESVKLNVENLRKLFPKV